MGATCSTCDSTAVAPSTSDRSMSYTSAASTAKLILPDGKLEEFSQPVKASIVLKKDPNCFICNSDDMEFDGFVSAVSADDDLLPGRLYFLLPLSCLRRPMQAEEMAALAVRASQALVRTGKAFVVPAPETVQRIPSPAEEEMMRRRRRKRSGSGGSGRSFASDLCAIPE
ncbi:hypothetical protein QJS10_CPA02g00106 [Acorus calamus]|uniref:Uncharacterized protein n=1 Tax=Acorus calamus TaxID=4465 RepID=A0AAV9FDA5_ACOCL|nr:hypothetical protein QJS10_CPA02g00106 [Acorus calamus]